MNTDIVIYELGIITLQEFFLIR